MHGFYAVMGGMAFEIPENLPESKRFLPSNEKEFWFLRFDRMNDPVAHEGWNLIGNEKYRDLIPNLSEEEIKSKSKANGLAKALVCIQALWFIANCITRRR